MTARELEEYRALRATIRERGTARVWIFVVGFGKLHSPQMRRSGDPDGLNSPSACLGIPSGIRKARRILSICLRGCICGDRLT